MPGKPISKVLIVSAVLALSVCAGAAVEPVRTGGAAFGDWKDDAPGVRRHITAADLPKPFATQSASRSARVVAAPAGALPKVPRGFEVSIFASDLAGPRLLRTAPNGDVFVAEMQAGRIRVLRAGSGSPHAEAATTFADKLSLPFGIAFYPPGAEPQWVYVANTDSVVRYPYRNGDVEARGAPEVVVARLPTGGHVTRDLVFSADGTRMFVSVGSESNSGETLSKKSISAAAAWDRQHNAIGAAWGDETERANVLSFAPEGGDRRIYATGLRNCVGLAMHPDTGDLWCSTNERDGLGDDLVPDFVTRVPAGAFFGWPWFYIGDNEDPTWKGQRADLKGRIAVPDVLLQPHSAPLQMTFYAGTTFPPDYHGHAFVATHGSWNRAQRTGYKIVRIVLKNGVPNGEYEDFMTGLVLDDRTVWGRPVGVTTAADGALLVSEDGNGTIWRIAYKGEE